MRIAIHQPQYLPWLGYFHKMMSVDLFVLLDDVQFKKNEWQHRNRIRNPQSWQWISVPNHYHFPQRICEVKLKNEDNWCEKHLKTIRMNYSRSQFFKQYDPLFEEFFSKSCDTMDKLCVDSIKLLSSIIGIKTDIALSSEFNFETTSTERLIDICRHFGATEYVAGAGAHNYMDVSLFDKANIRIEYQDFECPVYEQHWTNESSPFVKDLSVIDLIFNCGDNSKSILQGVKRK